jgi:tetratricopeptide (TPR) repeat protein
MQRSKALLSLIGRIAATALCFATSTVDANTIKSLDVRRDANGLWQAQVEYSWRGEPSPAYLVVELQQEPSVTNPAIAGSLVSAHVPAQRGDQSARIEINRPAGVPGPLTTVKVLAHLKVRNENIASQTLALRIDWPDLHSWLANRQFVGKTNEQLLAMAEALIDVGNRDSLDRAKPILERLLEASPRFEMGYVELARVAMKSNWGPQGLRQAQTYLQSALTINPDSANAKILLGYVLAHQGQPRQAEALFEDAARANPRNLWLWANWGEALVMQGRIDAGIQKYRMTITRARTHDTYDRARLDAFRNLIRLFDARNDLDGLEALHKQRSEEFGAGTCHGVDYARFMLQRRGNFETAIDLAKASMAGACRDASARHTLGAAHYLAWSATTGPGREDRLNQARVYLPSGPELVYQLAASDRTLEALKQLQTRGEAVDQKDNGQWTALAYALGRSDAGTVRRLLRFGARPQTPVGPDGMPVAWLPVLERDLSMIRTLKQAGIAVENLKYNGVTAAEHARRTGDRELLEALGTKAQAS